MSQYVMRYDLLAGVMRFSGLPRVMLPFGASIKINNISHHLSRFLRVLPVF